jgi:hypothetical protein
MALVPEDTEFEEICRKKINQIKKIEKKKVG